ncbi:MAG: hypothetical protein AB8I08_24940 [Sandaracinaceae bacterium]
MNRLMAGCALGMLLVGCADPCEELGAPSLEIGTSDANGVAFETVAGDDTIALHTGLQGGAHVFLHARIAGICPTTARLDRRVVDARTADLVSLNRGPVDFVSLDDGRFELAGAAPMTLCPDLAGRAVEEASLRFVVSVEDAEGRQADAQVPFTASCEGDATCEAFCAAP